MSQTATTRIDTARIDTARIDTMNATPVTSPPGSRRGQAVPAIALGLATFAAILSVIAITTAETGSGTPSRPAVQQQKAPAGADLSRTPVVINLDACGRPIIPGRMACR